MKKITLIIPVICFAIFAMAFATKHEAGLVIPKGWPKPRYDVSKNPITEKGFELGRKLFFDPLLSKDSTVSCASCHLQFTGYTHTDHAVSHGIYGRKGTRNTLALSNLAWSENFLWDGGVNNIEVQPLSPIENPAEMDNTLANVVKRLNGSADYRKLFDRAFPKHDTITGQQVLKALTQFMLSLQSYNSKYDKVMRKEPGAAFTAYEAQGLAVFRQHCASCHSEPLFTNNGFENNGLPTDTALNDTGRMKITGRSDDSLKFKVPSLRNVEVSYPYMHDGRYKSLQMVLFHYTGNISKSKTLAPQLAKPLDISEKEKGTLVAFLKTLTDETFLRNPNFYYTNN